MKNRLRDLCNWVVYIIVRLFVCAVQAVTMETCQRVARWLAVLAVDVTRIRFRVVDDNLRHAFPNWSPAERRKVARAMWEHLILMVCEVAHLPRKVRETNWRNHIQLTNIAPQVRALFSRRPCVIISGHFGNFEVGGYMIGMFGFKTYSIARPLDNPLLDRWVTKFREMKGQHMLPKADVARRIAVLLEEGKNLALLGDQYAGPSGCWIDFFGRPASYYKAIALFSMTSGAPMIVSYARRSNGPMQIELGVTEVFDPLAPQAKTCGVREITQWYNDLLEQIVRRDPEQYWWVHRRWKERIHLKRAKKAAHDAAPPEPRSAAA